VLCLVAFGAVMVYSASSASTVVKGGGDGTGLLLKYLMYGAAGFVALRIAARVPLQRVVALTGPLLAVSFGLLVLVKVPGFGITAAGAVLVSLYAVTEPYRMARLTSFLNPWDHAGGAGFQAVQGQIAIGSGGLFGNGLGQSVQKIFYLPEAHTDFILAIIGEE